MKRRIVVTGCGVVTPLGCNVEKLWSRVCQGESGIGPLSCFDPSDFRSRIGGQVQDFSTEGYICQRELSRIERFAQFAVVGGIDAVRQSGIDFQNENPERCAAIVGSGVGGLLEIEVQHLRMLEKGPKKISVFTIPKMMLNAASGHLSILYNLHGPTMGVASACASASNAITAAARLIQHDEADVVLTGGAEAAVTTLGIAGFCAMRALSERNDEPHRASRPFDKDRDGFVLSEGAGMLLVEELEHARARGATILAEILGWGETSDALHVTQPDPEGAGAARAMQEALRSARLDPPDLDYINAHGTSTVLGDVAETCAVKRALGEAARGVAISSTKSQLGHLLGGSGGVELILAILAMRRGVIPPTINLDTPDPQCDLDYTPHTAREKKVTHAMSNSFGFGGHNVSIVVGPVKE